MLSVDNFRYNVSLCLWKPKTVGFSSGICGTCALASWNPWGRGKKKITRYFDDSLLTRNPDVAEEASEWLP